MFFDDNWQPAAKVVCTDNEMSKDDVRKVSVPKGSRLRHANAC
jgi:hypothetical protein